MKSVLRVEKDEAQVKQEQRQLKLKHIAEKRQKGQLKLEDIDEKLNVILEMLEELLAR